MTKVSVFSFEDAGLRFVSRRSFSLPYSKVFPAPQLLLGFFKRKAQKRDRCKRFHLQRSRYHVKNER